MKTLLVITFGLLLGLNSTLRAESQGSEYKGVTDPFGDPANYEFAEDEKEDKEFFHLGRYLMFGIDVGVGIFTGGLGRTVAPGFYVGGRIQYFFDKAICLEAAIHYSNHLDTITLDQNTILEIDTNMIPINVGFRYYFDTKNAPKAIAIANPYLAFGGGMYMRGQNVIQNQGFTVDNSETTTNNFGGYGGGGVEFTIYRRHIYLGVDLRYHLVFFTDEAEDFGQAGAVFRDGDYFTTNLTITYNF